MDREKRKQVMEPLRGAAEALEADDATEVIMPGWDEQFIDDRERGIRIVAEAVRARGKSPDDGTRGPPARPRLSGSVRCGHAGTLRMEDVLKKDDVKVGE